MRANMQPVPPDRGEAAAELVIFGYLKLLCCCDFSGVGLVDERPDMVQNSGGGGADRRMTGIRMHVSGPAPVIPGSHINRISGTFWRVHLGVRNGVATAG